MIQFETMADKKDIRQKHGSAGTSLNQVPKVFKVVADKIGWKAGTLNVDIGGGRFDTSSDYLRGYGVQNLVFDTFNRQYEHNCDIAISVKFGQKADSVTCCNVLNVIDSAEVRRNVILQCAKALKPEGTAYIGVYAGNRSGIGAESKKDCWQNNQPLEWYIPEVERYFGKVVKKYDMLICTLPVDTDEKSVWYFDDRQIDGEVFGMGKTSDKEKIDTFHFSQHLSAQLDNGESYDWSKVLKLAKELNIEATPQELMQACEVAIVMSARRMISQHSEWSAGQCFEQMKRLYSQQPIISTNSSDSLRWQQYSTPCPISYLAGLYVSQGNPQYGFYEPTAGNGMLTIALPVGSTVVNEIDPVRFENLKKAGYAQTFNGDAVALANSEYAQRNYNVIMNPPFGNLKQSEYLYRDGKVADNSATYTFKRLDHKIAVLSLEKFLGDNGARAAIIVGGKLAAKYNKADDEAYWNKQGRLQGAFGDFISYLNRAYLVDDIFYIDGKLYAKQGTQFPIVLILVRGRRKQWDSDPLCKWRTYDSIKDKPVQSFDELMIRMRPYLASNEHDALLERLNAKLVRLEKMKIEGNVEPTAVPEPELKHKYDIGDSFLDKDNIVCTIVDRFVSDGKIGYYLMYDKMSVKHPVIAEENWLDSMKKLPNPKFKIGQMIRYLSLGGWKNGYVRSYSWSNLFDTYTYEIICFSGGMSYEIKEYNMSEISLGYSEEKCYSISEPVCKKGDLIRDRKTKNTYTVRQVLLYNVDHKYKNQRFGVGGTVVKSSASYLYYVSEHPSPYSEKEFTVVNKGLGDADSFEKYQVFIQNALHSNSHEKIECTDLISEHSRQVVNRLLKKNIKGYYIKADDIRHTRNEHGKQSEYLRNQIPITDDDLAKIPEILSVPTNIDLPPYNMRNGQGVRFVKQFPDGKIFCVMVDLYESDELSIKTGYKKGIEGFETLMPPPLQGIDELQQAVPKHNARNARALPMLVANVTNFFRIK